MRSGWHAPTMAQLARRSLNVWILRLITCRRSYLIQMPLQPARSHSVRQLSNSFLDLKTAHAIPYPMVRCCTIPMLS